MNSGGGKTVFEARRIEEAVGFLELEVAKLGEKY
jgi:hypothetical protein